MKLGSLFSGSGGFELAGAINGIEPVWASEIEPYPIKVTKARFPQMKHLGSVLDVDGAEVEPVDIITFGSPCQDLSVAGKQAGLHKGERSNLFFEAIRIIKEMLDATQGEYPKTIIWENVPGAFSSNVGKDIESVLDSIQNLGFVIDMNVLDAQNMGVPQRRRRIYLLGCNAKHIATMRTFTSWNIITQIYIETLLTILNAQLNLSEKEPKNSVWKRKSLSEDGLKRMMKLFAIEEKENFNQLLKNWGEISLTYLNEPSNLEFHSNESEAILKADTQTGENPNRMEAERLIGSISKSWQSILGETLNPMNLFTTLTATSETTESIIYGCASLLENTQRLIGLFKNCYQVSYETELFISTGRKVCIDYARARQASGTLFNLLERVHDWDAYLRQASETDKHFVGDTGAGCEPEILPLKEGLRRDSAPGGEKGQGTAEDAEGSVGRGSVRCLNPWDCQSKRQYRIDGAYRTLDAGNSAGGQAHGVCYPIDSHQQDSRFKVCADGISPTLPGQMGTGGNNGPMVLETAKPPRKYIIRRLTPLECCRLQGFPDWWEDGIQGSDSARYKMWGNGIALPNAEYVIWCAKKLIEEG